MNKRVLLKILFILLLMLILGSCKNSKKEINNIVSDVYTLQSIDSVQDKIDKIIEINDKINELSNKNKTILNELIKDVYYNFGEYGRFNNINVIYTISIDNNLDNEIISDEIIVYEYKEEKGSVIFRFDKEIYNSIIVIYEDNIYNLQDSYDNKYISLYDINDIYSKYKVLFKKDKVIFEDDDTVKLDQYNIDLIKELYVDIYLKGNGSKDKVFIKNYYCDFSGVKVIKIKDYNLEYIDSNYNLNVGGLLYKFESYRSNIYILKNDFLYTLDSAFINKYITKIELFKISLLHNEEENYNQIVSINAILDYSKIIDISILKGLNESSSVMITNKVLLNSIPNCINLEYINVTENMQECYYNYKEILYNDSNNIMIININTSETGEIIKVFVFDSGYVVIIKDKVLNGQTIESNSYISKNMLSEDNIDRLNILYRLGK